MQNTLTVILSIILRSRRSDLRLIAIVSFKRREGRGRHTNEGLLNFGISQGRHIQGQGLCWAGELVNFRILFVLFCATFFPRKRPKLSTHGKRRFEDMVLKAHQIPKGQQRF